MENLQFTTLQASAESEFISADEFISLAEANEDAITEDICNAIIEGIIDKDTMEELIENIILDYECCWTLKIKYWFGDVDLQLQTKHDAFNMLEIENDDRFDYCKDLSESTDEKDGELTYRGFYMKDFHWQLVKVGKYTMLTGGFSA